MKAYDYQIWQSLLAWIRLNESELLYLEGAEDIDKYGPNGVSVTQVKHSSRSVTLRSPEITEAINNFWRLRKINPREIIRYRFLTIAESAVERGSPFGDKPGLEYWGECARSAVDLELLQEFLLTLPDLSEEVRSFIEASSSDEIRRRLIEPIAWDAGSPSFEKIKEDVDKEVVYHGNRLSLTPEQSRKATAPLIQKVWQTVCKKEDRFLEKKDFLEDFANATYVNVPVSVLSVLAGVTSTDSTLLLSDDWSFGMQFESIRPPLPQPLLRRPELIGKYRADLERCSILTIHGAAATGKTTLASLLTDKPRWSWLSLRGVAANRAVRLLKLKASEMDSTAPLGGLVLDDLDFHHLQEIYETYLVRFLNVMISLKKRIVITSQTAPPQSLDALFSSDILMSRQVPYLDYDEVLRFAKECGCSTDSKLNEWVPILLAKTKGHPSLVAAWIRRLMAKNWPAPELVDIVKSPDIADVLKEARQRLADTAPSEAAKNLAYKLSIIRQPFRKDHALTVAVPQGAHAADSIAHPGAVFDCLVGPWIEPLSPEYYRISPLLEGAGQEVFVPHDLKTLHRSIAEAFYQCTPITYAELKGILIYGLVGQATVPVASAAVSLLQRLHESDWRKIRDDFVWLLVIGRNTEEPLYPSDAWTSLLLRILQYHIAAEPGHEDVALSIRQAWESEIQKVLNLELKVFFRIVYLTQLIIRLEVTVDLKTIAEAIMEIMSLLKVLQSQETKGAYQWLESADLARGLLNFASPRCRNVGALRGFLEALEEDAFETRKEFLALAEENLERLMMIFDSAWIDESKRNEPNWQDCLKLFERIAARAVEWEGYVVAAVAYRCIAVIEDEQLHDPESALDALSRGEAAIPSGEHLIQHVRAGVLHHLGEHTEALSLWGQLVEQWDGVPLLVAFQISRWGQLSAAATGNWGLAAQMALYGQSVATDRDLLVRAVEFKADMAFALWKSGAARDSLTAFAAVLDSFQKLPDPETDLASHTLCRLVGHAIGWVRQEVRGVSSNSNYWEPPAARFSNPVIDDRIRGLTVESSVGIWWMLAQIESREGLGDQIFRRLEEEVSKSDSPDIQLLTACLRIERCLGTMQLETLLTEWSQCVAAFRSARARALEQQSLPGDLRRAMESSASEHYETDPGAILMLLEAGLVRLAGQSSLQKAPIEKWKHDCAVLNVTERSIIDWFVYLSEASSKTAADFSQTMTQADTESSLRILASLFLVTRRDTEPRDLLYACILLATRVSRNWLCEVVEKDLERIVIDAWTHTTTHQRFKLTTPNLSAKAILDACSEGSQGLRKVARICLAARLAVNLHLGNTLSELERIAATGGLAARQPS